MNELPENWIETEIGNLCSLKNGRAFKPNEWQTSGLPIVRIQNLNNPAAKYNYFQGEVDERNRLRGGELLFAWSGTPGTSFGAHVWRGSEAVLNQHIFRVDFDEALLDKRFFRSAINQKLSELIDVAHGGVGLRHVTKGVFEKTLVALPPRPEQTRIANQLDTLLTRIQSCNDRFDAIPALLKRFRQTVMTAGTSGGLTAEWRGTTSMNDWTGCTVGQVLNGKPRNGYSPQAVDYETPVRSLTLSATTTGKFLAQHSKFINQSIADDSHLWLEPGDILIQRANSLEYVGVSAIFEGMVKQFIYPDLMMKCRPNGRVMNKYLFYALSAESTRNYFRENATGTAGNMPKINQQTVMSAPIFLPPLEEQAQIIRRVEALFILADRIEARATAARAHAQRLSPLVLAKAFRGELVPQDPQDEPANVLLQRLVATKPAKVTASRGRARLKTQVLSPVPLVVQPNWAALPDAVWAAPEEVDEHTVVAVLVAVLKTWGGPMPQSHARLAAVLCQQPRQMTAVLPADQAMQWRRLVGAAAEPLPAKVASFQPATNGPWRKALAGMRARGDLVEVGTGPQGTWAMGPGAAQIETSGWPEGRAGWVVAYLRAQGVEAILPLLEPLTLEFVHAKAA